MSLLPTFLVHFSIQNEFMEAVIIMDECGVFGRKGREMWA
jgi:hypothetical protein